MSSESENMIREELPEVAEIVRNECWLEGERRGEPVRQGDPVVQVRVADIILNGAGEEIRSRHHVANEHDPIDSSAAHEGAGD